MYQGAEVSLSLLPDEVESDEDLAKVNEYLSSLLKKVAIAICSDVLKKPEVRQFCSSMLL